MRARRNLDVNNPSVLEATQDKPSHLNDTERKSSDVSALHGGGSRKAPFTFDQRLREDMVGKMTSLQQVLWTKEHGADATAATTEVALTIDVTIRGFSERWARESSEWSRLVVGQGWGLGVDLEGGPRE